MSRAAQEFQRQLEEMRRKTTNRRRQVNDEVKPDADLGIEPAAAETEAGYAGVLDGMPEPLRGQLRDVTTGVGEGAGMAKKTATKRPRAAKKPAAKKPAAKKPAAKKPVARKAAAPKPPKPPKAPRVRGDLSGKLAEGPGGKTVFVSGTCAFMRSVLNAALKSGALSADETATAERMFARIGGKK